MMGSASGQPGTLLAAKSGDRLQAVVALIEHKKLRWTLPADTRVVVGCEGGPDAFWIYRAPRARGVECVVIDPASTPIERHR